MGKIQRASILAVSLCALIGLARAAHDRFSVKALNGIGFAEFRGYETWQDIAVSETDDGIKAIVGNATVIDAFRLGAPGDGKLFPEGSMMAKIEWSKKDNDESPYSVTTPGTLKSVAFMKKDSKRFATTNGWGYAQFNYDAKSGEFSPFGKDASFGKTVCHQCHLRVTAKDYVFTAYPLR
jgi:hypothetical protein